MGRILNTKENERIMEKSIIELRKVWKIYDLGEVKVPAVRDVSLHISKGDYVVILGPSGSGKSTMMNMVGALAAAKQMINLLFGSTTSLPIHSVIGSGVLAVLVGMNVSVMLYKIRKVKSMRIKEDSVLTATGTFLSVLVPACASCGIGLAAVFGIAGGLAVLPFEGIEVVVLGVLLLGFSLYQLSVGIGKCTTCKV